MLNELVNSNKLLISSIQSQSKVPSHHEIGRFLVYVLGIPIPCLGTVPIPIGTVITVFVFFSVSQELRPPKLFIPPNVLVLSLQYKFTV